MKSVEWDDEKAEKNKKKHGVDFNAAMTVFEDPNSITIYDSLHSKDENRFVDIGYSQSGKLLVVVYAERGNHIRLISSRPATRNERKQYESNE